MKQTFKWKKSELIFKKKNIKEYERWAIPFNIRYEDLEETQISSELTAKVTDLMTKIGTELVNEQIVVDEVKLLERLSEQDTETKQMYLKYCNKVNKARRLFIVIGDNAKELCDKLFENSDIINHDEISEDDEKEYLNLMVTILDFFLRTEKER